MTLPNMKGFPPNQPTKWAGPDTERDSEIEVRGMGGLASPPPYRIRDARDADYGFILDAWRRSFQRAPACSGADEDAYRASMGAMVAKAWRSASFRVACDTEDDDVILGFAVTRGSELLYVYVRGDFRGAGIGRALVDVAPAIKSYVFRTLSFDRKFKPQDRGWLYTPVFAF